MLLLLFIAEHFSITFVSTKLAPLKDQMWGTCEFSLFSLSTWRIWLCIISLREAHFIWFCSLKCMRSTIFMWTGYRYEIEGYKSSNVPKSLNLTGNCCDLVRLYFVFLLLVTCTHAHVHTYIHAYIVLGTGKLKYIHGYNLTVKHWCL
jgi:hypothetical protein